MGTPARRFSASAISSASLSDAISALRRVYALEVGGSPAAAAMIFACRGLGNMVADIPAGYAAQKLGDAW